ncbi:hypothetical protein QQZ08_008757 [Neonectria magnoliae]|uniref:Uncharacterized protein n=1 Tax=Neonectria magnoliae TaxID=2732573 RepID=A0ABR1HSV9_9HYPO
MAEASMQTTDAADVEGETWIGITDVNLRRRIQNRINQRESSRQTARNAQSLRQDSSQSAPRPIVPKACNDGVSLASAYRSGNSRLEALLSDVSRGKGARTGNDVEMLGSSFTGDNGQSILALSQCFSEVPRSPNVNILLEPVSCVADAQRIWHYALTTLLPTLGVKTREGEPLTMALYRSATLEPAVFYATLAGGAVQRLALTHSPEDARVLLIAQTKTAEAVRESLTKESITDGTLFAIMALALKYDSASTLVPVGCPQPNGFLSPVRSIGGLDWLGHLRFNPTHASMWIKLLRDRLAAGSSLPGLTDYLQLSDLYRASLALLQPEMELYTTISRDNDPIRPSSLWNVDDFHIHDALHAVITDMWACCQLIEQVSHQRDLNYFIRRRNEMQHHLLCLPRDQDKVELLAVMLFSYGVIFPISDPWPLTHLTKKLCFEILDQSNLTGTRRHFLLWASVIGGISAWGGELQEAYTLLVAKHAKSVGILDWDHAVRVLDQFLWLDAACDAGGRLVWNRALMHMEVTA